MEEVNNREACGDEEDQGTAKLNEENNVKLHEETAARSLWKLPVLSLFFLVLALQLVHIPIEQSSSELHFYGAYKSMPIHLSDASARLAMGLSAVCKLLPVSLSSAYKPLAVLVTVLVMLTLGYYVLHGCQKNPKLEVQYSTEACMLDSQTLSSYKKCVESYDSAVQDPEQLNACPALRTFLRKFHSTSD